MQPNIYVSLSTSELRLRLANQRNWFKLSSKIPIQGGASLGDHLLTFVEIKPCVELDINMQLVIMINTKCTA